MSTHIPLPSVAAAPHFASICSIYVRDTKSCSILRWLTYRESVFFSAETRTLDPNTNILGNLCARVRSRARVYVYLCRQEGAVGETTRNVVGGFVSRLLDAIKAAIINAAESAKSAVAEKVRLHVSYSCVRIMIQCIMVRCLHVSCSCVCFSVLEA